MHKYVYIYTICTEYSSSAAAYGNDNLQLVQTIWKEIGSLGTLVTSSPNKQESNSIPTKTAERLNRGCGENDTQLVLLRRVREPPPRIEGCVSTGVETSGSHLNQMYVCACMLVPFLSRKKNC